MARPSKYETHVQPRLTEIADWARNGVTDKQIGENLGISQDTFIEYKKRYPEFSECLKRTRELVDAEVENALLKRALGYTYKETTIEVDADGRKKAKTITREVIPDTLAQLAWLKHRRPKEWGDTKPGDTPTKNDNPLSGLSEKELRALAADGTAETTDSG